MLVVQNAPKTFVLVKGLNRYIFRVRDDGQMFVRFIHPQRRYCFDMVVSAGEARKAWTWATTRGGYYWW